MNYVNAQSYLDQRLGEYDIVEVKRTLPTRPLQRDTRAASWENRVWRDQGTGPYRVLGRKWPERPPAAGKSRVFIVNMYIVKYFYD